MLTSWEQGLAQSVTQMLTAVVPILETSKWRLQKSSALFKVTRLMSHNWIRI